MLDPVDEEGERGLQEWWCVAQHRSWLSDCEGSFLGRSLQISIGQLTSAPPSLQSVPQSKRQKEMAAYFELVPCVPVGSQAGALGELQTEERVDKPPGPQSHDDAISWTRLCCGTPYLWLTLVLLLLLL